jgi:hypothetical protein
MSVVTPSIFILNFLFLILYYLFDQVLVLEQKKTNFMPWLKEDESLQRSVY